MATFWEHHRVSFSETKSKNFFSRIFVNCDVTHYNWTVTSYVAVRVLVRVYMHDVTSDVWRHQKKIFKVKVQHSEKSGFVTERHFRKQNPRSFGSVIRTGPKVSHRENISEIFFHFTRENIKKYIFSVWSRKNIIFWKIFFQKPRK